MNAPLSEYLISYLEIDIYSSVHNSELKLFFYWLQALLISDTSYDLEKLDEEEAGEADDQSEEGK